MANESIASSASFFEPSMKYSEENTHMLYQHVKMNLQEIHKMATDVDENMKNLKKNMSVTMKLLSALKPRTEDKND